MGALSIGSGHGHTRRSHKSHNHKSGKPSKSAKKYNRATLNNMKHQAKSQAKCIAHSAPKGSIHKPHKKGPNLFEKIKEWFKPKPKVHKHPQPTPEPKPTPPTSKREEMPPIEPKTGKLEVPKPKPDIKPVPINEKTDPKEHETYNNFFNNHEGFSYKKNQNNEYQMDIKGQNLPESVSNAAFNVMHNDESSIELGKKDFGRMFTDMKPSNEQNKKPLTRNEFLRFHETYVKNATGKLGQNDTAIREKEQTVDLDATDRDHLNNLFSTMAGKDDVLTQQEYTDFQSNLFKRYASGADGQDKKVTREEQNLFMQEWNKTHNQE